MEMDKPILQASLGQLIADQLRKKIWSRELSFGERLLENELSEKYDVSRSTIREALKILENEEMVISKARKGTYVAPFSTQDWKEIIELRTLIETHAFVQALPQLDDSHFQALMDILNKMKAYSQNGDWNELFNLDMKFHNYIVNLSGNNRIIKIYNSIQMQIRTFHLHLDQYYSSPEVIYLEHKELLEVLQTKDSDLVDKCVRNHIEYVEEKLLAEH